MRIVQCSYCRKIMPPTNCYQFTYNKRRRYFCSREEAEKYVHQVFYYERIKYSIGLITGLRGDTLLKRFLKKWMITSDFEKIDCYLTENRDRLMELINEKGITASNSRLSYLNACIENEMKTYEPPKRNLDQQLIEFYKAKNIKLPRKKTIAEYESEFEDDDK